MDATTANTATAAYWEVEQRRHVKLRFLRWCEASAAYAPTGIDGVPQAPPVALDPFTDEFAALLGPPPPSLPPSPPPEEMEIEEEAVDTAAMTPLGDADYVLALEWDGTYLGLLPDRLLKTIFGPLQLLLTLEQIGFKWAPVRNSVHAYGPLGWGEPWDQYFYPIPSAWAPSTEYDYIRIKPTPTLAHVAKLRDSTRPKRKLRYKRARREAVDQVLWFSDALLHAHGMHAPFRLFTKRRSLQLDVESVPCDGGPRGYLNGWPDRSNWFKNSTRAWERVGCTFEKPQHRFLGEYEYIQIKLIDYAYDYAGSQRALYDAERRAFTTDLRDCADGYNLWNRARDEWGRTFRESNHGLAARGEPTRKPMHVRDSLDERLA
jgi:hypothetical protein